MHRYQEYRHIKIFKRPSFFNYTSANNSKLIAIKLEASSSILPTLDSQNSKLKSNKLNRISFTIVTFMGQILDLPPYWEQFREHPNEISFLIPPSREFSSHQLVEKYLKHST